MMYKQTLQSRAIEAFHKWEDEKYGDKTPLADMHVDMWIEAYVLGHSQAIADKGEAK